MPTVPVTETMTKRTSAVKEIPKIDAIRRSGPAPGTRSAVSNGTRCTTFPSRRRPAGSSAAR